MAYCWPYKLLHFVQLHLSLIKILLCYGMIEICGLLSLFSFGIRHSNGCSKEELISSVS